MTGLVAWACDAAVDLAARAVAAVLVALVLSAVVTLVLLREAGL